MQYEIFELNFHDGILLRLYSSITGPGAEISSGDAPSSRLKAHHQCLLAHVSLDRNWLGSQWASQRAMWLIVSGLQIEELSVRENCTDELRRALSPQQS